MTRGTQSRLLRVGPEHAEALARLSARVLPSVLAGLPGDGPAQWAERLEALAEPTDVAFGLFAPDGSLRAYAQVHWRRALDRTRHIATLSRLIATPDRRGEAALAALLDGLLGFTRDGLALRRVEVMLDRATAWMAGRLRAAGFVLEATCPVRAAVGGAPGTQWLYAHLSDAVLPFPPASPLPPPPTRRRGERIPKLVIRSASEADAEALCAISSSEATARGTLQHPRLAPEAWRERLGRMTGSGRLHLVAEVVAGKRRLPAGSASIVPVSDDPREAHVASLGIGVHGDWQGRGVGRALMEALIDHADRWAHYARVELQVFADNARAIALYESLGFVREGIVRDSALREGGYADSIVMGRLHPALRKD